MKYNVKKNIFIITLSLAMALGILAAKDHLPLAERLHWKIYDVLVKIENKFIQPPAAIKDIVLVSIDNETLMNIPWRWPYSRSNFAKVIENLLEAEAKAIAFDFAFIGSTTQQDDAALKNALEKENKTILATAISEDGSIDLASTAGLGGNVSSGIVTKFQDADGVTRKNLTYMVSNKEPSKGFLSWGMQILKTAEDIDLLSLTSEKGVVSFKNYAGQKWAIPVDPKTKAFLINFRAHTNSFCRVPFHRVLSKRFDPGLVKNKIVLIGLLSSTFGDIHNTPLGFLPGITLNANAFLTLYARDFLKSVPKSIVGLVIMLGVGVCAFFVSSFDRKTAIKLVCAQIIIFLAVSCLLLACGWVWNLSFLPALAVICPFLAEKIYLKFEKRLK